MSRIKKSLMIRSRDVRRRSSTLINKSNREKIKMGSIERNITTFKNKLPLRRTN
jgi:hypothetical protein